MNAENEKAQNAVQREPGTHQNNQVRKESMNNNSISYSSDNFDPKFILRTKNTRVWVQPQDLVNGPSVIELTDDKDANLLFSPSEALSVAAALQAVAVHLLEEPRTLCRKTEPGEPGFGGRGGGL